jgi:putative sterol carrier protein
MLLDTPASYFAGLKADGVPRRMLEALPEDVVIAFHIDGDTGGSWQLSRVVGEMGVSGVRAGPKDCEIHCSSADFMALVTGGLNARKAYMAGRIRVQGDIGLVIRLGRALRHAA